jgi:citrate synthase
MPAETLTITDNRTGKTYELPIEHGTIRAMDLRQIKTSDKDFGLMTYDPAYVNTASCKSTITFIDGDAGILNYRGYPIEQLAEQSSYLEVAYLLMNGELPGKSQLEAWTHCIISNMGIPESLRRLAEDFRHDAHPMGMLVSLTAALGTFYRDANNVRSAESRRRQYIRLIAKFPTLGALIYRHLTDQPFIRPDHTLTFAGNFLRMLFQRSDEEFTVNPVLERALNILFILHADHEQNCSTSTMRLVASAETGPFSSSAAAAAALYGPLHGGANEAVLRMLREIGSVDRIPEYIARVKTGEVKLMGFGHRVYKNYDPRARIIKRTADEVFEVCPRDPLLDIAVKLEAIALQDEYFVKRKLYPNVDFYSGIIYQAMGFPAEFFTVMFAIPRVSGWLAQWEEMMADQEQKIGRPRQVYLGSKARDYVPMFRR